MVTVLAFDVVAGEPLSGAGARLAVTEVKSGLKAAVIGLTVSLEAAAGGTALKGGVADGAGHSEVFSVWRIWEGCVKDVWVEPYGGLTSPMEEMPIPSAFRKSPMEPGGANFTRLFLRLGGKLQRIALAAAGFRSARGLGLGDIPGVDGDHAHPAPVGRHHHA